MLLPRTLQFDKYWFTLLTLCLLVLNFTETSSVIEFQIILKIVEFGCGPSNALLLFYFNEMRYLPTSLNFLISFL